MAIRNRKGGTRILLSAVLVAGTLSILGALRLIFAPAWPMPHNAYFVVLLLTLFMFAGILPSVGDPFSSSEEKEKEDEYFSDEAVEQRARDAKAASAAVEANDSSADRDHA